MRERRHEPGLKKIGVVGLGPETSAKFYLDLVKEVRAAGATHKPTVVTSPMTSRRWFRA